MKRLLIFFLLLFSLARGEAQTTTTADRVVTKSLYLRDWWVDSVKRDTNFLGAARSIPTAAAVYNFVAGRGAPGYTSVTALPDSSGLIFHGPNGVQDTVVFEGETGSGGVTQATLDDSTSVLRDSINALRADIASGGGGASLPDQSSTLAAKEIWVTDMGAIAGDGLSDVAAIRAALYKADTGRIKTVNVPGGIFLLDDTLSIPAGVTLKGSYQAPLSHSQNYDGAWSVGHDLIVSSSSVADNGSALYVTHGSGDAAGSPTITLNTNSKIEGFLMYWPNQVDGTASAPTAYPWAIKAKNTNNAAVENIEILNAYQGIFFEESHRGSIRGVTGSPLYKGVYMAGGGDVNRLENIHFGPWYAYGNNLYNYVYANATAFEFGREDLLHGSSLFCYGYGYGLKLSHTPAYANSGFGAMDGPTAPWAELSRVSFDVCTYNIYAERAQINPVSITGGHFTSNSGNPVITLASGFKGRLNLVGSYLYSNAGKYAVVDGSGQVTFDGCTFSAHYDNTANGWNEGSSANTGIVASGTGAVAVRNSQFSSPQPQISLGASLSRAIFTQNLIAGALNVSNSMSAGYVITDNAVDTSSLYGEGAAASSGGDPTPYGVIYDTYTGAAGNLTAHVPEIGAGLSKTFSKTGDLLLDGSGFMYHNGAAGVESAYEYAASFTSADQRGTMRLKNDVLDGSRGSDDILGFMLRANTSGAKHGYEFRVDNFGGTAVRLQVVKWVSGTATVLHNAEFAVIAGTEYNLIGEAVGSTITLRFDGTAIFTTTDTDITGGATELKAALCGYSANGGSDWKATRFIAEDL